MAPVHRDTLSASVVVCLVWSALFVVQAHGRALPTGVTTVVATANSTSDFVAGSGAGSDNETQTSSMEANVSMTSLTTVMTSSSSTILQLSTSSTMQQSVPITASSPANSTQPAMMPSIRAAASSSAPPALSAMTSSSSGTSTSAAVTATTRPSPFSGLDTDALVAIAFGCVLMFFICLIAVYVLVKVRQRRDLTDTQLRTFRKSVKSAREETGECISPGLARELSSPMMTTTAGSSSSSVFTFQSDTPLVNGPGLVVANRGKRESIPSEEGGRSWVDEPEVEESDFTSNGILGRHVVNNVVVVPDGPGGPGKAKGKNVRARERAREMMAERGRSSSQANVTALSSAGDSQR